jgi:hypothetical protein
MLFKLFLDFTHILWFACFEGERNHYHCLTPIFFKRRFSPTYNLCLWCCFGLSYFLSCTYFLIFPSPLGLSWNLILQAPCPPPPSPMGRPGAIFCLACVSLDYPPNIPCLSMSPSWGPCPIFPLSYSFQQHSVPPLPRDFFLYRLQSFIHTGCPFPRRLWDWW